MRDELTMKVTQAIKDVWLADRDDSFDWTAMASAAIDELAKADTGEVWPTQYDANVAFVTEPGSDVRDGVRGVLKLVSAYVTPILAAQRARIAELEKRLAEQGTAEVLRRVREDLQGWQEPCDGDESCQVIDADVALQTIDDELDKLTKPGTE
jgi:hypothetical protein